MTNQLDSAQLRGESLISVVILQATKETA